MAILLANHPKLIRRHLPPLPLHLLRSRNVRNTPSLTTQMTFQLGTPLSQLVFHLAALHLKFPALPKNSLLNPPFPHPMEFPLQPNLRQVTHLSTTPPAPPKNLQSPRFLPSYSHLRLWTSLAHQLLLSPNALLSLHPCFLAPAWACRTCTCPLRPCKSLSRCSCPPTAIYASCTNVLSPSPRHRDRRATTTIGSTLWGHRTRQQSQH